MEKKNRNVKNEILHYDNKIVQTKEIIKKLNKMEDDFVLLDENFGKCLDLLNDAVKGHKTNAILSEAYDFKNKSINDTLNELSKNKAKFSNIVNQYIKTKEKLEEEYKQQLNVNNKN